MKNIIFFYLNGCPHCKKANTILQELFTQNPQYKNLDTTMVEEKQNADIADKYDYFYVPCFYVDGKKLHEGAVTKEKIKAVLDSAMEQ
ncbi:MAG: thioredoxin family protein [Oscillospiraceae bacterium]